MPDDPWRVPLAGLSGHGLCRHQGIDDSFLRRLDRCQKQRTEFMGRKIPQRGARVVSQIGYLVAHRHGEEDIA